jgi:signal transduction histidine kinase
VRGAGSAVFAGILLVVAGTINIIYGIGALGDANVFVNDTRLIFSNLNTLGWVLIILGVIQLTAGFSLFGGGTYGRVIGIAAATLGAIESLMSVGGAYPFWSLGLFAICVIVIHGLVVLGEPERT